MPEIARLLDLVFENYPDAPEWAEIKEEAYLSERPVELITELTKVLYLYGNDPSAFDQYMFELRV